MKTYQQTLEEGYKSDWATECSECHSFNCHAYSDVIICFDCNNKVYLKNAESLFIDIIISEEINQKSKSLKDRFTSKTIKFTGSGNTEIGVTGELIFEGWLNDKNISNNNSIYSYTPDNGDFIINGNKIDLKTQSINFYPKLNFLCNVAVQQIDNADYFVFGFYYKDRIIFVGFQEKDFIKEKGILIKKGTIINNSGMVVINDMINLRIKDLIPMFLFQSEMQKDDSKKA